MPSVKSYRNRLEDIKRLQSELAEQEYQARKLTQEVQVLTNEMNRIVFFNQKLMQQIHDYLSLQIAPAPIILKSNREEVKQLESKIQVLEQKLRIYRDYILKTYGTSTKLEDSLDMVEMIPPCLKPLDAIEYAANQENSSEREFDRQS